MKLLALLVALFSLGLLPRAALAPAGDGDAAAAVAARNMDAPAAPLGGVQNATTIFVMSGSAKMIHLEGGTIAGDKPFKNVVKTADAIACIQHDPAAQGCDDAALPENDVDPNVYLFFDDVASWRIADNPAGTDALELEGLIDGKGGFQMAGTYDYAFMGDPFPALTSIYLTGKVTFEKGTLNPVKISGKLLAVSIDHHHYGSGSFKAVPLVQ